jgi:hypothetical protein
LACGQGAPAGAVKDADARHTGGVRSLGAFRRTADPSGLHRSNQLLAMPPSARSANARYSYARCGHLCGSRGSGSVRCAGASRARRNAQW